MNETLDKKQDTEDTSAPSMSKNNEITENKPQNEKSLRDDEAAGIADATACFCADGNSDKSERGNEFGADIKPENGNKIEKDTDNISYERSENVDDASSDCENTASGSRQIEGDSNPESTADVMVGEALSDSSQQGGKKHKKKCRFWKGLLIYCVVMVAVVLVASGVWFEYLREYENTLPENTANEVAYDFKSYLSDELKSMYSGSVTEFESLDSVVGDLLIPAIGNEFTYSKLVKEYTTERPVYSILSGKNQVAKIALENSGEKTLFGFEKWKVSSFELLADMSGVNTLSYKIKAPLDFSVYVNGIKLDDSFIANVEPYDNISKWEKASADDLKMNVYEVSGLYCAPTVAATGKNGNSAEVRNGEIGLYICDFPSDMRHDVKITVPYGASAYLGGEPLTDSEISNGYIECGYTGKYDNARLVEYTVRGLIAYPDVIAYDRDNNPLEATTSENENYVYEYSESMKHSVFFAIPSGDDITIRLNGSELENGMAVLVGENHIYPELSNIRQYISGISKLDLYRIDGIYGDPDVEAFDGSSHENGLEARVEDGVIYFFPKSDDTLKNEHEALVEAYIDAYIRYTSGGYKVVDTTFKAAAAYLIPDSPAYESLLSTKFSFGQNKEFFIKSREIKSYDYIKLGDNCFSCTVDFTAEIYTTYTSTVQNVTDTVEGMKLWYVKSDGEWKIAGLKF